MLDTVMTMSFNFWAELLKRSDLRTLFIVQKIVLRIEVEMNLQVS